MNAELLNKQNHENNINFTLMHFCYEPRHGRKMICHAPGVRVLYLRRRQDAASTRAVNLQSAPGKNETRIDSDDVRVRPRPLSERPDFLAGRPCDDAGRHREQKRNWKEMSK